MKNLTEIVFIIDKSGSMFGLEKDTIGGFNSTIQKQLKEDGIAYVSTILFNGSTEVLHDRVELDKIMPLTLNDYQPAGSTALYDALGGAINHIRKVHRDGRKEDLPEKTIFIITTDGMENASHRYSRKMVKELISHQQEKHNWEFIFLGANIDSGDTAESIGIKRNRARNYVNDCRGVKENYACMSEAISYVRQSISLDDDTWKKVDR